MPSPLRHPVVSPKPPPKHTWSQSLLPPALCSIGGAPSPAALATSLYQACCCRTVFAEVPLPSPLQPCPRTPHTPGLTASTPCPSTPACPRPACFLSSIDPSVSTTPPLGRAGHLAGLALSPAPLAPVVPVPGSPALGTSLNGSLLGAWSSGSPAMCRVGFLSPPQLQAESSGWGSYKAQQCT